MENNNRMKSQYNKGLYEKYCKRLFDITLALIAITFLLPFLVITSLLVKWKLGSPIFFRQPRPGKNEKIFYLIKYRSMNDFRNENGDLLPDNLRLTKFGKFLRKSSIDELPELINILKGEMSFIGPRPLSIFYLPYYSTEERKRHLVRPGLTGLAQINGRNMSSWNEKLKHDLEYVNNVTFFNDMKILLKTFTKVLKQSNITVRTDDSLKNFNVWKKVKEESNMTVLAKNSNEIGSDFEMANPTIDKSESIHEYLLNKDFDDYQYTFSGRSAIAQVLEDIAVEKEIKVAYVPSYCCISMIQPFLDKNIKVEFYDVVIENEKFEYKFDNTIECDLVLYMEYFGFHTIDKNVINFLELMKNKGTILIQDVTHSLFNDNQPTIFWDYQVASIRKWCAIPSGGIAYKGSGKFKFKTHKKSDLAVKSKIFAMELKKEYLDGNLKDKNEFLKLNADFSNSLIRLDKNLKIDEYSLNYLKKTSVSSITYPRKENAVYICNQLKTCKLFFFPFDTDNLKTVIPLFVPIIFTNTDRDDVRKYLINNQIYLPIHWPEEFGANSSIKRKELSIVCDQRYTPNSLSKIIDLINEWKK